MNRPSGLRFEAPGEVLKRRVSLLVGAAVLFATSLVLGRIGAPAWGALVEQGLAVWLLVAFASKNYRSSVRGVVHADASGVRLDAETVAARSAIANAFLLAQDDSVVRIIRHRASTLDIRLESEEQARALLVALGLGTGQSISTFAAWYGGRWRVLAVGAAATMSTAVLGVVTSAIEYRAALGSAAPLALGMLGIILALTMRYRTRVDVGSDGVLLRRLGEQRFVPYRSMAGALFDAKRNTIVITLSSGQDIRLSVRNRAERGRLRDDVVERIDEARASVARDGDSEGAKALIAPGGRELAHWLKEIRALAGARTYRDIRLDEDRLWSLVDDAAAQPATRAGAAIALSTLDEPSRIRLRVAAEACAEPKLRVALTRVAEGASDVELEEALAPLLESKS